MATVNLGAIKFNWKGAYSNSTAYAVDDVVSSGGSSYICILASQGNAVSNSTYWNQMSAAGTNGTNGTDVGTVITTQGDILYRDGSGLQRLAAGTAGQVLQTGGSGANPSWTSVSSDVVKVKDVSHSGSNVSTYDVDGFITSDYDIYEIFVYNYLHANSGVTAQFRVLTAGGVATSTSYEYALSGIRSDGSAVGGYSANHDVMAMGQDASSDTEKVSSYKITLFNPMATDKWKQMQIQSAMYVNNSANLRHFNGAAVYKSNTAVTGVQFSAQGQSNILKQLDVVVYGRKS